MTMRSSLANSGNRKKILSPRGKVTMSRTPYTYFAYQEEYDEAIRSACAEPYDTIGPTMLDLEERLAKLCGKKYAIVTTSCTMAMFLSLRAVNYLNGFKNNNILIQNYTYTAVPEQCMNAGFNVYFNDIEYETSNIELVNEWDIDFDYMLVTGLYGNTIDYDELQKFKETYNIKYVIDDAAQSFPANWDGKPACSFADISCLSFESRKCLTTPFSQGGAVVTDDEELYNYISSMRAHGSTEKGSDDFSNIFTSTSKTFIGGINGFIALQNCAALSVSLNHLEEEIIKRNQIAETYKSEFKDLPITYTKILEKTSPVYCKFQMFVENREIKEALHAHICAQDVLISLGAPPKPLSKYDYSYNDVDFYSYKDENAQRVCDTCINLPIHPMLTDEQVEHVIKSVRGYFG